MSSSRRASPFGGASALGDHPPSTDQASAGNETPASNEIASATSQAAAVAQAPPPSAAKKRRKSAGPIIPRRKKPKDMPKRPLSAYNLFFREEREKILAKHRQGERQDDFEGPVMEVTTQTESKDFNSILFQAVARTIANRWRTMKADDKKVYEDLASTEIEKYRKAVEEYERKMVESSSIGKRRQAAVDNATANELKEHSETNRKEPPRRELSSDSGSIVSRLRHAAPEQASAETQIILPQFLPGDLHANSNIRESSMTPRDSNLGWVSLDQTRNMGSQGFPTTGFPSNNDLPFTDRLLLPSRNTMIDSLTLRHLDDRQLHQQSTLAGAFPLGLQPHQPEQHQLNLSNLHSSLVAQHHIDLLSDQRSFASRTINDTHGSIGHQALLEQILREQGRASFRAPPLTNAHSTFAGTLARGLDEQQNPYSLLSSHFHSNFHSNFPSTTSNRNPANPIAQGPVGSQTTAISSTHLTATGTGNSALSEMSSEDLNALVRFLAAEQRRRQP